MQPKRKINVMATLRDMVPGDRVELNLAECTESNVRIACTRLKNAYGTTYQVARKFPTLAVTRVS